MMISRAFIGSILLLVMLLLVACGEPEEFSSPAASGNESSPQATEAAATSTPDPSPTPNEVAPDVQMYADQYGVSPEEARDRLNRQGDFGPLNGALEANERETFGGAFLQHEPEFRFVVLFTRDGEETIRKYVDEGSELDEYVEVRHVRYSFEELQEIRTEADEILAQVEGFNVSSSINVFENRVEYFVQNSAQAQQVLADAGLALPEAVALVGDGPPVVFDVPEEVPGIYIAIPKPTLEGGGAQMDAQFFGSLVLINGCLWLESDFEDGLTMPIWHYDHRLQVFGETIEVVNGAGEVIARVGERIYMGGGGYAMALVDQDRLHHPVPDDCRTGSVWGVGSIDPLDQQPEIPTPVPEGVPLGLHTVEWPADLDGARALLEALPEQLSDDLPRWVKHESPNRIVIGYGPQDQPGTPKLVITDDLTPAANVTGRWTVSDFIGTQFMGVGGLATGGDGTVVWASEDTTHTNRNDRYDTVPVHALNWGRRDGLVLFTASAGEYEQLELLVAAVVEAAE